MSELLGLHHILLSVTDLRRSADWYQRVFDLTPLKEFPADTQMHGKVVYLHPSTRTMVGLVAHRQNQAEPFSEFRTGLDHAAFTVADRAALEGWSSRFESLGVHHSAIAPAIGGDVLVFRDPDNVQLQLWAPNQ
jgi:glyoxylase I family protein